MISSLPLSCIAATGRSSSNGKEDDARSFLHSAYCCIPLHSLCLIGTTLALLSLYESRKEVPCVDLFHISLQRTSISPPEASCTRVLAEIEREFVARMQKHIQGGINEPVRKELPSGRLAIMMRPVGLIRVFSMVNQHRVVEKHLLSQSYFQLSLLFICFCLTNDRIDK
jgi:hypothetical protein